MYLDTFTIEKKFSFLIDNLSTKNETVAMKNMTVSQFKSEFSEVLQTLKSGAEISVSYGKKHETIGVLMPKVKKQLIQRH